MPLQPSRFVMLCAAGALLAAQVDSASAEDFSVGTENATSDFDLDGVSQTHGSLGVNNASATILAVDLPLTFTSVGVVSTTLDVTAVGGNIGAIASGISPRGIGVDGQIFAAQMEDNEGITLDVSSVGSSVVITGLTLVSVRDDFFPFTQLTLTGATFGGGDNTWDGEFDDLPLVFDAGVSSVTITSNSGGDAGFSIGGVSLAVPEPTSAALLIAASLLGWRRQRPA